MALAWYAVHTYAGHEDKVRRSIEKRSVAEGIEKDITQVIIPTEEVTEVKGGKKRTTSKKYFPGYILVEMEMNERSWNLVATTPGVTGFVGSRTNPSPLRESEVAHILNMEAEEPAVPKTEIKFEVGEKVKVTSGPFANFNGSVEEIFPDKGKVKVMVTIFGRPTPVELDVLQCESI